MAQVIVLEVHFQAVFRLNCLYKNVGKETMKVRNNEISGRQVQYLLCLIPIVFIRYIALQKGQLNIAEFKYRLWL